SDGDVRVMAFKKADESSDAVVRVVEMSGKEARNVRVTFAAPVASAREVNGQELPMGPASVASGELVVNLQPYEIKSYAVKLAPPRARAAAIVSRPVVLHYDLAAATNDGAKPAAAGVGFDSAGNTLAAAMLPMKISYDGVDFQLAHAATGVSNAVVARGQTIQLPAGAYNRVYILAAADGDQQGTFKAGERAEDLTVQDWKGFVGQWYDRSFTMEPRPIPAEPDASDTSERAQRIRRRIAYLKDNPETLPHYASITPGFIKRAPIAWFASHYHDANGANVPYAYSYLFAYSLDLPASAHTLTLPDNDKIRILAVTVAQENARVRPAQPLYDTTASITAQP
ncbi:MAG: glycosyl hydrolase-related protein, partial [Candidatus Acidiferrales bacterium]